MKRKTLKISSLILAFLLLITFASGCDTTTISTGPNNSSSAPITSPNNTTTTSQPHTTTTTSNISTSTSSSEPSHPYHPPHYHPPHDDFPYDDFNNADEANIYKNAPKDTVHILMWRDWHKTEQKLIEQYEKLTGAKIITTITTEAEYREKLISMIFENNAPDIVTFQSNDYPGILTQNLQPLETYYFKLSSDCWNKAYMDAYKINNLYFGVAMPSTWLCESGNYITYYSPTYLKKCGVKQTPYELYKKNNWNWETQNEIIRKVNEKGGLGLCLQSYDSYMLSAGEDFVTYNGKQYTNKLGTVKESDLITKAWMEVAKLKKDNCVAKGDLDLVVNGKFGLATAISYGLYNESGWFTSDFAKTLEAVPVAGPKGGAAYTPVKPVCWGLPKKAKNPKGAAYFLRYFLDVSNYNQSSTFHTKQFETVFKTITSASTKKAIAYGSGASDYTCKGNYNKICDALVVSDPANTANTLNSTKKTVTESITRANKDLARVK